ncbi:SNF1-related protein kinase regulatory subunit beta-1-like [Typha angustifolia]|uniref:SNF1-related protein kinase regulatory subunit beta-1-like n=1 Tax=Typha angustifolia TaxID=59011 RepID=UPI003C2AF0DA
MGNVSGRDTEEEGNDDDDDDPSLRSSDGDPRFPNQVRRARSAEPVGGSPPRSPARSRSPLMFAPQIPVPPLQRAADGPPVFNQMWMSELPGGTSDGPSEKEIPALLVWTFGGKNVLVEGSWDNWTTRRPLQKSGKDFSILLALPSGVYHYRFIVDGERRYVPDFPCVTDEMGQYANLLDLHEYVPENIESVTEFESPPSPDSSYSFLPPLDQDYAKEPPALPSQLHLTVLGMQNSEESSTKPQHVVLNHLFIEKGLGSQSLVALGLTHRFLSKYVTVVLYKPVER